MSEKSKRIAGALLLALASAAGGYLAGTLRTPTEAAVPSIPAVTIAAPPPSAVRIIYSLDKRQNDQELIALIEGAHEYLYFAIYTFTLENVADALIAAKERGVDVRGVVDREQAAKSFMRPVIEKLVAAGIPVRTKPPGAGGIMHIKMLATENAYATGSYNWTKSATTENDEILEIGTDPALIAAYTRILRSLFDAYAGTNAAAQAAASRSAGDIDYTEAPAHVGESARVHGILIEAYTSASGTVFLDFCESYKTCPFSGVIFADDAKKFGDLARYEGTQITLTGIISSYQGRAEIKLSDPSQLRGD